MNMASASRAEFIGQAIDLFEDFSEQHGISWKNTDRPSEEGAAIIYGSDYDFLAEGIWKAANLLETVERGLAILVVQDYVIERYLSLIDQNHSPSQSKAVEQGIEGLSELTSKFVETCKNWGFKSNFFDMSLNLSDSENALMYLRTYERLGFPESCAIRAIIDNGILQAIDAQKSNPELVDYIKARALDCPDL